MVIANGDGLVIIIVAYCVINGMTSSYSLFLSLSFFAHSNNSPLNLEFDLMKDSHALFFQFSQEGHFILSESDTK